MVLAGIALGAVGAFLTFLGFAYSSANNPLPGWIYVVLWIIIIVLGAYWSDLFKITITFSA